MNKKIRLFALVGVLGLAALSGAQGAVVPIEPLCMCACPDGTVICVSAVNGDCGRPCAQAMKNCPSDM